MRWSGRLQSLQPVLPPIPRTRTLYTVPVVRPVTVIVRACVEVATVCQDAATADVADTLALDTPLVPCFNQTAGAGTNQGERANALWAGPGCTCGSLSPAPAPNPISELS